MGSIIYWNCSIRYRGGVTLIRTMPSSENRIPGASSQIDCAVTKMNEEKEVRL
jgi:hypothetical protein